MSAAEAAEGARRLRSSGRSMGAQRDGSGASVAAASTARPWGSDEAGLAFERRYRPVEAHVLAAWEQLAQYVESLGEAVERSVRDNSDGDEA